MKRTPTLVKDIYAVVREVIEDYAGEDALLDKTDGIEYAEQIAKIACNAHEDLISAVELALTTFDEHDLKVPFTRQILTEALAKAVVKL